MSEHTMKIPMSLQGLLYEALADMRKFDTELSILQSKLVKGLATASADLAKDAIQAGISEASSTQNAGEAQADGEFVSMGFDIGSFALPGIGLGTTKKLEGLSAGANLGSMLMNAGDNGGKAGFGIKAAKDNYQVVFQKALSEVVQQAEQQTQSQLEAAVSAAQTAQSNASAAADAFANIARGAA